MGRGILEEEMERLRARMQHKATELGIDHPVVIRISQQLDEIHNQWNRWSHPSDDEPHHQTTYTIPRYSSKIREVAAVRI